MLLSTGEGNNNNRFEIGLIRCELSFLPSFFYSHLAHEQRSPFIILSLTIGRIEAPQSSTCTMMMLFVVLKTLQPQLDDSLRLTCSLAGETAKASLAPKSGSDKFACSRGLRD